MRKTKVQQLHDLADYIFKETGHNVRSSSQKDRELRAVYLFYVMAKEFVKATALDMSEITGRSRPTVYQAIRKHSEYAKKYYQQVYNDFDPYILRYQKVESPFHNTIKVLETAKQTLEHDFEVLVDNKIKNGKVYQILKLVEDLEGHQLDTILERLPPIIKMAQ